MDTWAHEVTSEQVQAWLSANQWAPKTWNVYLGDVRTVFQWGKQRGHVTLNPCDGVARKALDDGEIDFLSVDACARLLDRAAAAPVDCADEDFRDCLAYVALGLFCGPRPERELGRKEWSDVKLEDKLVVVSSGRSKTRARRVIDLPDNAVEWLRLCPRREGRIAPRNFRRKWRRLREACGLYATWPHNALQHTFATMHLAHHQDERRLQLLMGHGSAQMLYQSYRGLTTRSEAARFWELRPEAAGTRQEAQGSRQEAPQCEPGRCSMAGGVLASGAAPGDEPDDGGADGEEGNEDGLEETAAAGAGDPGLTDGTERGGALEAIPARSAEIPGADGKIDYQTPKDDEQSQQPVKGQQHGQADQNDDGPRREEGTVLDAVGGHGGEGKRQEAEEGTRQQATGSSCQLRAGN